MAFTIGMHSIERRSFPQGAGVQVPNDSYTITERYSWCLKEADYLRGLLKQYPVTGGTLSGSRFRGAQKIGRNHHFWTATRFLRSLLCLLSPFLCACPALSPLWLSTGQSLLNDCLLVVFCLLDDEPPLWLSLGQSLLNEASQSGKSET